MRILWSYEAIAQKMYSCWECDLPIMPGDHYLRETFITGGKFRHRMSHIGCPIDPDEDEKHRKGFYEESESFEFKKAA